MSGKINRSPRISETSANQSGSSMHFWGVCCESGKQYAQVVGQRFRITMAVLDPKSFQNDSSEKVVSLIVLRGGIEYLLCILKHGEIHQVNLNLIFDKGENVKFYINGHGKVYLSGYQLTDSEGDVVNDENGYLCPLVEVQSKSRKSKVGKVSERSLDNEPVASTSKQQLKTTETHKKNVQRALWSSYISETIGEDEIESDEDVDFSISDEESDDEELSDDIEPSEIEDLTRDLLESDGEDSDDKIQNATDSRKRRLQEKSSSPKRSRTDIQNASTSMENGEEIICLEDNGFEVSSTSNFSVNSAGNTPIPKKDRNTETPFGEKMSKKERRLREILKNIEHLDDSRERAEPSSSSKSPKQAVANSSKSSKHPLVKLDGGVEIQDVIVGRGPEAINGKMLHIFFVGRLPNNEIFDSRVPGSKPFSFRLGSKEVIKGWEVAMQGMRVGGRRKMKIPPNMAYGAAGAKNIPEGATLRFVVDLQSVS